MHRRFYIAGFLFGLLGVILGAFATHGLKPLISAEAMQSLETGIEYQMYHAFLLLVLGNVGFMSQKRASWIFYLIITGILLFSGSIYLLSTNSLTNFNFSVIGWVTPIGGSLLILCWIILVIACIKLKNE